MDKKKTKKSKKGKKNWRKNIDVTEIEEKEALFNKKQREEKEIENLKDEDLFDFDFEGNKNKMRRKENI
ncbi:MAG: hypothetical protein MJ252_10320 [archaeon]|nr:hypothetical protein [archaeon]